MTTDKPSIANQAWVKAFLKRPILARLATCNPHTLRPHVVPVWFEWDGQAIWISAFLSTRKVRELQANPQASVIVDLAGDDGSAPAVLFEGPVELITDPQTVVERSTNLYTRYLGVDGVLAPEPQSWMHDPENLIIKLTPHRVYAWGSPADKP
jgi:PPOX class probable F420-dependent enzyme